MFDKPIKTIQQAKEFFMAMGCSGFHMDREHPERYSEYKKLNISTQTEKEWIQEQFSKYYDQIMEASDANSLWILHSAMERLLASISSQVALSKMLNATRFIRDKVPLGDRIMVAETINGEKYRQGLIYLAYDWNNIPAAQEFAELSMHFSTYNGQDSRKIKRCESAIKRCNKIKLKLQLQ